MSLLSQNSKLKKTSKITGIKTFNFTLPAKITCPKAGACKEFCYASKGAFTWSNVKSKHIENYVATKKENFNDLIIKEIAQKKIEAVRIHDSGDFYNKVYLSKWVRIAMALPDVTFYAYTKSLNLFKDSTGKNLPLPKNMTVIFSFGGKLDHLIDVENDRHALIYTEKLPKGYSYANDNDHIALASHKKIGLKLH